MIDGWIVFERNLIFDITENYLPPAGLWGDLKTCGWRWNLWLSLCLL